MKNHNGMKQIAHFTPRKRIFLLLFYHDQHCLNMSEPRFSTHALSSVYKYFIRFFMWHPLRTGCPKFDYFKTHFRAPPCPIQCHRKKNSRAPCENRPFPTPSPCMTLNGAWGFKWLKKHWRYLRGAVT